MSRSSLFLSVFAVAAFLSALAAKASMILPGTSAFVSVQAEGGFSSSQACAAVNVSAPTCFGVPFNDSPSLPLNLSVTTGNAGAGAAAAGGADPSVAVSVSLAGGLSTLATANLTYSLEIVGPAAGTIPVDFSSILLTSFDDALDGVAEASVSVSDSSGTLTDYCSGQTLGGTPTGCVPENQNIGAVLQMLPNHVYTVSLSAGAEIQTFGGGSGPELIANTAAADPTFAIDPTFSQGSQYSIVFSSDLSPAAVPEPRPAATLGAALCIFLFAARRTARRSKHEADGVATPATLSFRTRFLENPVVEENPSQCRDSCATVL